MRESDFIDSLRAIATHPAARGLADDCAVLDFGGTALVLTHDTLVEGVHFLPTDPPESVAWKLIAVNLSDLAAKGATPVGALLSYTLSGDAGWDAAFADGLDTVLQTFAVALLGGDTVRHAAPTAPRSFGATLIGRGSAIVPSRSGAKPGDRLYVTGVIGDAGLGLERARADPGATGPLIDAYRLPQPQLAAGAALAPLASAMMDVSDGLLIDARRMADASGVGFAIDLDAIPLSPQFVSDRSANRAARLSAATSGDDYQLLLTSALPLPALPCPVTQIGTVVAGSGLHLGDRDGAVPLPPSLGWEH